MTRNEYAEDALFIDSSTSVDEIKSFIRRRASSPIHVNGVTVWNFSSFSVDEEALKSRVGSFDHEEYVIPFQVGPLWGLMYHLLPRRLKHAEVLVYHTEKREYRAYNQFIRQLPNEEEDEFRYQIAQIVSDIEGDVHA